MAFDLFSSKKSTTNNTTNYNDSSANAGGDNSVAVGSGANLMTASGGGIVTGSGPVNIETSDPETVARSLAYANASDRENTARYMATLETLKTDRSLSAVQQGDTEEAARRAIEATNSIAAALLNKPYETDTAKLAATNTVSDVSKYITIGTVAVVVLLAGLYFATRNQK